MQGFKAPRSATPPPPLPAPTLLVQVQGDDGYNHNALDAPQADLQILEISRMASSIAGIYLSPNVWFKELRVSLYLIVVMTSCYARLSIRLMCVLMYFCYLLFKFSAYRGLQAI